MGSKLRGGETEEGNADTEGRWRQIRSVIE